MSSDFGDCSDTRIDLVAVIVTEKSFRATSTAIDRSGLNAGTEKVGD